MLGEIKRKKEGGAPEAVSTEAKAVVEDLTGWKYEQCFGANTVGYQGAKNNK